MLIDFKRLTSDDTLAEASRVLHRAELMLLASWIFFLAGLALFLRSH